MPKDEDINYTWQVQYDEGTKGKVWKDLAASVKVKEITFWENFSEFSINTEL